MITKKYKAYTSLSINVLLESNKNLHISFEPKSNGTSTYATSIPEVQRAMERDSNYNDKFFLDTVENDEEETPKTDAANTDGETDAKTNGETDEQTDEQKDVKKVKVNDMGEAKDYLANTFGISRTHLRSGKQIMEAAAANNVEFEGLE